VSGCAVAEAGRAHKAEARKPDKRGNRTGRPSQRGATVLRFPHHENNDLRPLKVIFVKNSIINLKVNTFELCLWDDEGAECTFYTVRWDTAKLNETDKFFAKYNAIPEFRPAVQLLLSFVLDSIGDDHGAVDALFNRFENEVVGLPNKGRVTVGEFVFLFPAFPLRLYALRIKNRRDLVVLFNGGVKSSPTNQGSSDLVVKWREACLFARRIDEALRNGEIVVDVRKRLLLPAAGLDSEIYL
jgi:hypothetical protein